MGPRVKAYGILLLVLALGGAAYYWFQSGGTLFASQDASKGADKAEKTEETAVPVELAKATAGSISSYLSSTSNLRAQRDVEITARVDGVVQGMPVEEGDFVREGQTLCTLDDTDLQITLRLTKRQLAQARVQLESAAIEQQKSSAQIENTKAELQRKETAFREQLVSEQEVAQLRYQLDDQTHDERVAVSRVKELGHRVQELEAQIEQGELEISRTQITAPFSGYLTERLVELGQTVRNQDRLFRLAAFSPLYADVHFSEQETDRIRPGQTAMVMLGAEARDRAQGRVVRVSPVVDDSTGTVKVTIELQPNDRDFRPGAFVRVDIETDTRENTVLIPKRAIVEEDGESYIFTAEGETAHRRKVGLGYQNANEVEVREGVAAGEAVVVAGQGNLKEGSKIRAIEG
ncbi:MAG TPA: efflux RND transporter periplasmic adaptor subunit [Bryobacterales bacterium]|nr:efflux RND transporter periplasmic adaptor subunit [Bryobacterales bacterium]